MAINSRKATGATALGLFLKSIAADPLSAYLINENDEVVLIKTGDAILGQNIFHNLKRDRTTHLVDIVGYGDGEYDVMCAQQLAENLKNYFCTQEAKQFFEETEAYHAFKGRYKSIDELIKSGEVAPFLSSTSMDKLKNSVKGGYLTAEELAQISENGIFGVIKRGTYQIDKKTGKRIEKPWSVGAFVYLPRMKPKKTGEIKERKLYAPRDFGQITPPQREKEEPYIPPALPKEKPKEEPVARSIRIDDNQGNVTIIEDSDNSQINIQNYPPAPAQEAQKLIPQADSAPQMPPAEEAKPQPLPPPSTQSGIPELHPEKKESAYNIIARANAGFPLSYGGQIGIGGMKWSAGLNFGSRPDEHTVEVREVLPHRVVAEADEYLRKNILLGAFAEYRQPIGNFSLIGGVEGNVEFQTREATSALYNPNGELMNKNTGSFAEKGFIGGIYGGLGYTIKVDGSEKLGIDFTAGYRRGFKKVPEEEQSTGYPSNRSRGVNIGLGVRVPIKAPLNKHKGNR